jgi:hypothetical protein
MGRDELAAGFFLVARDGFTGKLRLSRERLGHGLVAAEPAQLLVAGRIAIADSRVALTDLLAAARPRTRLERVLRSPRDLDPPGAFTASLLRAHGAEGVLDPGSTAGWPASWCAGSTTTCRPTCTPFWSAPGPWPTAASEAARRRSGTAPNGPVQS